MAAEAFTAADVLGKGPGMARLQDHYAMDKELGKGAFGVVHLVSVARRRGRGTGDAATRTPAPRRA